MVKANVKQTVYFIIGVLAIVAVAKCQMVETSWHRAGDIMEDKRSRYTKEITLEELNWFIKTWPEFNELKMLKGIDRVNLENRISDEMTLKMRVWFVYRHWDAERFFYVRSRLVSLLDEITERREAKNIIAQLKNREDDVAGQMIKLQNKRIRMQKISENELLMLTAHEEELRQMFKQYP